MKAFLRQLVYLLFSVLPIFIFSQTYELPQGESFQKVKFKLVNNLIVFPVAVNGVELTFLLDSGVSKPILFNLSDQDSIPINNVSEIIIKGLGGSEPIKALSSTNNTFRIGNAENSGQLLYVVMDRELNLSPKLGLPVHGIIGYDLFRDFVVEINYTSQYLKLHKPDTYQIRKDKRTKTVALRIVDNKAYVKAQVFLENKQRITVKLLVDSGSSDAIWLFENEEKGLGVPKKNFYEFLGQGLGGSIYGKRTRLAGVGLAGFRMKDAKAAFPDKHYFKAITSLGDRNGSLGGELLKRFTLVFNYTKGTLSLRKNRFFKNPFNFNMSGIDLQHNGVRYISESIGDGRGLAVNNESKSFGDVQLLFENSTRLSLVPQIVVSGIRNGSPAYEAGLQQGDIILAVNGKRVHHYKLQHVLKMLNEKIGKRIKVLVARNENNMLLSYVLKDVFK